MEFMSGNFYWQKNTNIKNIYPYLTTNIGCDVLIIGGGISGAITAYFLAKEGANVVVAEKNIVGYGQTLASSAIIEAQPEVDIIKLEKIIGSSYARKIYKLSFDAMDKLEDINAQIQINSGFERKDLVYFTNRFMQKSQIQKEFENRKKLGLESVLINNHNIIDMQNGMIIKNASATVNPYLFTQGIFETLEKMPNVRIFENTKIDEIKYKGEKNVAVSNNKFKITSDSIIFTSGIDSLKYIDESPVQIFKTYTIVTKPIKEYKKIELDFTARDNLFPHHYMRFTQNGRLIFGGEDVKLNEKFSDEKYANMLANDRYRKLKLEMDKMLPGIEDATIEYAFNASVCKSKDGLPVVDEIPNMQNCFLNIGFGTNGILHSVIGADMLKNAIKGFYTKDMNMFKIDR